MFCLLVVGGERRIRVIGRVLTERLEGEDVHFPAPLRVVNLVSEDPDRVRVRRRDDRAQDLAAGRLLRRSGAHHGGGELDIERGRDECALRGRTEEHLGRNVPLGGRVVGHEARALVIAERGVRLFRVDCAADGAEVRGRNDECIGLNRALDEADVGAGVRSSEPAASRVERRDSEIGRGRRRDRAAAFRIRRGVPRRVLGGGRDVEHRLAARERRPVEEVRRERAQAVGSKTIVTLNLSRSWRPVASGAPPACRPTRCRRSTGEQSYRRPKVRSLHEPSAEPSAFVGPPSPASPELVGPVSPPASGVEFGPPSVGGVVTVPSFGALPSMMKLGRGSYPECCRRRGWAFGGCGGDDGAGDKAKTGGAAEAEALGPVHGKTPSSNEERETARATRAERENEGASPESNSPRVTPLRSEVTLLLLCAALSDAGAGSRTAPPAALPRCAALRCATGRAAACRARPSPNAHRA